MLKPLVKYPGGKERELKYILPNLPKKIDNYYEPFVGGGAVYFALNNLPNKSLINDKSTDLINLYNSVKRQDEEFFETIYNMSNVWKAADDVADDNIAYLWEIFKNTDEVLKIDTLNKYLDNGLQKIDTLNKYLDNGPLITKYIYENVNRKINYLTRQRKRDRKITYPGFIAIIHTAFKSAVYMYYRYMYNLKSNDFSDGQKAALYLFMRQYAYSSMFRFSKTGKFNVPYGGRSYNNIILEDKITYYKSENIENLLTSTVIENMDFQDFLEKYQPKKDDFLFIDPPYDSEFSKYDNLSFDAQEQKRLAKYLVENSKANWMIVIKDTELVRELYKEGRLTANGNKIYVNLFNKEYSVNFKNRNSRKTHHLLITNYKVL